MANTLKKAKGERLPSYRLHKPSGQGVVTLAGKDHYCGKHNTAASKKRYRELVAEWLAGDKRPLKLKAPIDDDEDALSIAELAVQFEQWAKNRYVKNGKQTQEPGVIHYALKPLVEMFGALPVNSFGPLALRKVRSTMVARNMTRITVNGFVHKIRLCFRWGVGQELVHPNVVAALDAVESLGKGREGVREGVRTPMPPASWFEEVIPHTSEPARSALTVQRWTGMRAGEVLQMRPCDVDTGGPVWWYVPPSHKTEHHGIERRIAIGPKAQETLRPLLKGIKPTDRIFAHRSGQFRGAVPTTLLLSSLLARTCKRLGKPYYRPHGLRKLRLTEVRAAHGIDVAQAVGGHSSVNMTEHYAKVADSKAEKAALSG